MGQSPKPFDIGSGRLSNQNPLQAFLLLEEVGLFYLIDKPFFAVPVPKAQKGNF